MSDIEKAIEYFYERMERGLINNDTEQEVYEVAIEALEKQIPKKPTDVYISQGKYEWGCSNCEHTLTKYMKFCKYCGQRLDD